MAKQTHYLLHSFILGTEVGFSERATEIPDEVTTMMQINALAIGSLKRDAKLARRRDPSLTHAQHLNALAAQRFGVRNYHELLQRVGTEVARPPATLHDGIAELANICTGASGQADTTGGTDLQTTPKASNPSPGGPVTPIEREGRRLGRTAHRVLRAGPLAGQGDGLKGMKVIYPDAESGPNPFWKK